ncbi:MAG: MBL fold metallo-hydrolase [Anaerolineales bacterium]|nr:MBL fold metallo-hydrolase [Anaerolineales bacterium]
MEEIAPDLFTFRGLPVGRVYLIRDEDGLTIIDGSIPPAARSLQRQLEGAGFQLRDIRRILLTHAHPDHVGAIPFLLANSDAELICSELEAPVARGEMPIPSPSRAELRGLAKLARPPQTTLPNMKVSRTVADGAWLPEILGGMQVVSTPGHAPGHLSFWQPERKILFAGDSLFNFRHMSLPWSFLTVDMATAQQSVRKLAQLDPDMICFGHGRPLKEGATGRLRALASSLPEVPASGKRVTPI